MNVRPAASQARAKSAVFAGKSISRVHIGAPRRHGSIDDLVRCRGGPRDRSREGVPALRSRSVGGSPCHSRL